MAAKNTLWRQIQIVLATFLMVFAVSLSFSETAHASTAGHSADDAINWVKSKVGQSLDYDGNGVECVDLIAYYYRYLGQRTPGGNGVDYSHNALPSGWHRYFGVQPQKGDILFFHASARNSAGHVAIYESDRSTYHQNFDLHPRVEHITYRYNDNGLTNPYWGVIRPDWSSSPGGSSGGSMNFTVDNATNITTSSARLTAHIPLQNVTSCGVYVGTTPNNTTSRGYDVNPGRIQNMWYDVTGLQIGTTYYYKFYCWKNGQLYWSGVKSFTTQDVASTYTVLRSNSRTIPDGDYYILSSVNQNYGLSINEDSKDNGANVHLWKHVNNYAPKIFHFTYDSNGYYKITNKNSGQCLDAYNGNTTAGTNVIQWPSNNTPNQRWNIASAGNGTYYLVPKHATNKALDIYGGTIANGTNIQLWAQNGLAAQKFVLKPVDVPLSSLKLSASSKTLTVGDTYQLTAQKLPSNTTNNAKITWTSSNGQVATVSDNGKVTAKKAGTTNITASCDGKKLTAAITVKAKVVPLTGLKLVQEYRSEYQVKLKAVKEPANTTDQSKITWRSSNTSVASVDSNGLVQLRGGAGTAEIMASCAGKMAKARFTVNVKTIALTGLTISPDNTTLTVGQTTQLKATKNPANTTDTGKITWSSSNGKVATVDTNGKVTAKATGTTVITATCSGKTARSTITVKEKTQAVVKRITMYRLYNRNSGEHFYTRDTKERNYLISVGWNNEGVGWIAPEKGNPVYRLYNKNGGEHHYTLNAGEKNNLVKAGWKYEGVGWYSGGTTPVYREYNKNAFANNHNYTTSIGEHNHLVSLGWRNEGIGWYGIAAK